MHEGATLCAWEDGAVDLLGEVLAVGEDETATGAAEGFVGGSGDDVCVGDGGGVNTRGDEPCDVCDVGHEECAAFIGDGAELVKVDGAWVG